MVDDLGDSLSSAKHYAEFGSQDSCAGQLLGYTALRALTCVLNSCVSNCVFEAFICRLDEEVFLISLFKVFIY